MAVGKAKSVLSKYGDRLNKAIEKHANDPVELGFVNLPGGITDGIAKLEEIEFATVKPGKQMAGEVYFRAMGIIYEPEFAPNGQKVKGLRTSIMEMVCDTGGENGRKKVTLEEHVKNIENHLKKLAGEEALADISTATELEDVVAILRESKPYFRFITRQPPPTEQFPEPKVFETWLGSQGLEDYVPGEASGTTDDSPPARTPAARATNGAATSTATKPAGRLAAPPAKVKPAPEPEPSSDFDEFGDLISLVTAAEAEDSEAQEKLQDMAREVGIDDEDIGNIPSWAELADKIAVAGGEGTPLEKTTAKASPKKKGDVFLYRPLGPGGKPVARAKEVTVVSSDSRTETCVVKDNDTHKEIKGVAWDALTPPE